MAQVLTKAHLDGMEARIQESIRGLNTNFNKGQGVQNGRFDRLEERLESVDVKLEAIIEMLAMRKELHNLVRVLKAQGVQINESEVFVN